MIWKIILLFGLLVGSMPINAQDTRVVRVQCGPNKDIIESLFKDFGERPLILGKGPDGETGVMTLWVNGQTRSWTIIVTHGERSCVIGGGQNFTIINGNFKDISGKPAM